jgi:diaminohydroxyphosphoribosylaminopyrimidine deaminase/5-amino-6-(5-phosphoribosylamino)uracil reductase
MLRALELADEAKGRTFPNPAVGAVIVKNGVIIGMGATSVWGGPHAERNALSQAGEHAAGAVLYVTLEPCCHHGKTPPCTVAIIASGISEVFVALEDPNPAVRGKGIAQLRDHGIKVTVGLLRDEASELNEDFLWAIQHQKAWVTLKLAQTLDGRIADCNGVSKWITGKDSREYVHELRRRHAAIAVGRSTLECDNPQLTVRHKSGYNPARIVFSNDTQLPPDCYFIKNAADTRTIVVLREKSPGLIENDGSGVEYWYTGQKVSTSESLHIFQKLAFDQNINSVFIEGGQRLASEFLSAGLVNRVYFFYGNRILGSGKSGLQFSKMLTMDTCISLENTRMKMFSHDFMISGNPVFGELSSD